MANSKIRQPIVAGQFYPLKAQELKNYIAGCLDEKPEKIEAIACMLPHAGYIYSGKVAVKTISSINLKKRIILLGPNHTGYGEPFSIMTEGAWKTPLGEVKIDSKLAKALLSKSRYLKQDSLAHSYEHSLEVELPILQYFSAEFEIIPIILSSDDLNSLKEIGTEIATVIKEEGMADSTLIVASSDMTHYEPQKQAETKDKKAIEAILGLNPEELTKQVRTLRISMCGYAPVAAMLEAAKSLGAKNATLIKYETSAQATGDTQSVVGYAGIVIY